MRLFRTILVVALLILFPALSWYYLQQGKDWRMTSVSEISEKTQLTVASLTTMDGDTLTPESLLGNFIIAADLSHPVKHEVLDALHDQFGERDDVLLMALTSGDAVPQGWLGIDCDRQDCSWLRQHLDSSANSALIDDSLRLRRTYDLMKEDERKKLVKHTAVIVPLEKREKLELRRDK